jgi:hypothetical protein
MTTAVGAPAPKPDDDDILAAIDKMTIRELQDLGKHLDDLMIARGGHIHAYAESSYDSGTYVCRCGEILRLPG